MCKVALLVRVGYQVAVAHVSDHVVVGAAVARRPVHRLLLRARAVAVRPVNTTIDRSDLAANVRNKRTDQDRRRDVLDTAAVRVNDQSVRREALGRVVEPFDQLVGRGVGLVAHGEREGGRVVADGADGVGPLLQREWLAAVAARVCTTRHHPADSAAERVCVHGEDGASDSAQSWEMSLADCRRRPASSAAS